MGLIDRSAIRTPVLPFADVESAAIGGTVRVRGLLLAERLAMLEAARARGDGSDMRPVVLARTVVAEDGLPVYDEATWEVFVSTHLEEADRLFQVALELNGARPETEKKS